MNVYEELGLKTIINASDILNGISLRAYDAASNSFIPAKMIREGCKYRLEKSPQHAIISDLYLSPGWIDLHTHIFDGFGIFGTNADNIGYKTGVCMLADAGTVGVDTLKGFRKYVEPTIRTHFRLFICISSMGVIHHHENDVLEYLNVEKTVKTINLNRDIICGVKVRIGSEVIRHEGVEPLRRASEAARLTGLPLMVHIGGIPPYLADVEPFLQKGDIVTHCFNGRGGDAWNTDGKPSAAMKKIIDKGVILDVGHGGASFSFDVCARAIRQGLPKISIGTDLHEYSRQKYVYNMATTLTKMLGLGMPPEDIISGVTQVPAEVLRLIDWCNLSEIENATLFRIISEPGEYQDSQGQTRPFEQKIVPAGILLNGEFFDLSSGYWSGRDRI